MPIDVDKALGAELQPIEFSYAERDVMLYALGIGAAQDAPTDPDQLRFVYENGLEVLPTFGVVPPFSSLGALMGVPGLEFNPMMLLHGEQYLEILTHPLPTSGTLTSTPRISGIYDKGKGALVLMETLTTADDGTELFRNVFSIFLRGEGGFGGERGPDPGNAPPERKPDKLVEQRTLPNQALIYRLNGDRNPLHADPDFATMGGFDRPILHGLCTFGFVGRHVLEAYADNDPTRFKSIKVRFARPVFPGETIVTKLWNEDERILLEAEAKERGEKAISNAAVELFD